MKVRLFITILLTLLKGADLLAQSLLSDSWHQSSDLYIYKISSDNLRDIQLKDKSPHEGMLQVLVASYPRGTKLPVLPRGNYVIAGTDKEQLVYNDLTVDDLLFKIISGERVMLYLYDSLGRVIDDARVKRGASILKFDKNTQTYNIGKVKDWQIIEVDHKGVLHYIEIEKEDRYGHRMNILRKGVAKLRRMWRNVGYGITGLFDPGSLPVRNKYTGFVVFSKPKYKPGETVRFKAHINRKGRPYGEDAEIALTSNYPVRTDTTLTTLAPYRPGMYEWKFKLSDSLKLRLDSDYNIVLRTKGKRTNDIIGRFRYEDYELKSTHFTISTEKTAYAAGDTVKIKLKATDENQMALYGGRVEIMATPKEYRSVKIHGTQVAFIPDTLWSTTVDMYEVSEKEVVLPDTVFPKDISMYYELKATYLSADNESVTMSKELSMDAEEYLIDFTLVNGMLTINERHRGKPQQVEAGITFYGENGETILEERVTLPHTLPVPWMASDVDVTTNNAEDSYFFDDEDVKENQIAYQFYRRNDSVYLHVDNPSNIPFWYVVKKGKKNIAEGRATQLHYSVDDKGDEGYGMLLSYVFGGTSRRIEEDLPFGQKNMNLNITTPTVVYPGQKVKVNISATDRKGKPVENADITAYAFTSKFQNYVMPNLAVQGIYRSARPFDNSYYEPYDNGISGRSRMNWEYWKRTMSLDTIEYYKFLYPPVFYSYAEPSNDGSTQIAPYVVMNGSLKGVEMLWIDGQLHYARQAQQLNVYTFRVVPGKHHLRFRTYDREIVVFNIFVKEGHRNIFSFNAGTEFICIENKEHPDDPFTLSSKLLKKKDRGMLTKSEMEELAGQLVTVDNHFGVLVFPHLSQYVELPAYISSGNTYYYLNPVKRTYYDRTLRGSVNAPVLAGPFPDRSIGNGTAKLATVYVDGSPIVRTQMEGGYHYTLYENYQKIQSWKKQPFNRQFYNYTPDPDFKVSLLTESHITDHFKQMIHSTLLYGSDFIEKQLTGKNEDAVLSLQYNLTTPVPCLISVVPEDEDYSGSVHLYYGGTRTFKNLPEGKVKLQLVFGDTTSHTAILTLYKNGRNYLQIDSIVRDSDRQAAVAAFDLLRQYIRRIEAKNPYALQETGKAAVPVAGAYQPANDLRGVVTGMVCDSEGEALVGAVVHIQGSNIGTTTDIHGRFELAGGTAGDTIIVSFIGYEKATMAYRKGYDYTLVLESATNRMDEIVVVAHGATRKVSLMTGSVQTIDAMFAELQAPLGEVLIGKTAGVMVRGVSSIPANASPLIVINGVPYDGTLDELDASSFVSVNLLKEGDSAIYGARAANGVILIQTNALGKAGNIQEQYAEMSAEEPGNSMRRHFHDDAFWQPSLRTDTKGEASFEVTYPDDITRWHTYFIAVGNRRQADKRQLAVQSFKTLAARLSVPRFAVRGDSLNATGRIVNHLPDSIRVQRILRVDGQSQTGEINMAASHVEPIPVRVATGDSVIIAYSLQKPDGYFDGEERTIPVVEQGLLQTHGSFQVINDTATAIFHVHPALGATTLHAETSGMELFLREIEKIERYPYDCNEQMASKIKALLSKKRIVQLFGKTFNDDGKINRLISRLERNRNNEGLWGWWNRGETEYWISAQVVQALLDAEEAGYKTAIDKPAIVRTLQRVLDEGLTAIPLATPHGLPFARQSLIDRLILLKRLDAAIDYEACYTAICRKTGDSTLTRHLKEMLFLSMMGWSDKIDREALLHGARRTLLGSLYWGEEERTVPLLRGSLLPDATDTENTLTAYRILKHLGGYEAERDSIRNYFFECRHRGVWQNTYESSRIVETIIPDMLDTDTIYSEVSMTVNGHRVHRFPHTETITGQALIGIKKTGTPPLFVTTYQQGWNRRPLPESDKGFAVHTSFKGNKDTLAAFLTAGRKACLKVKVNIDADAEYVQVEVPIPAGCTYESKTTGEAGKEVHREYFKEKVVIFCHRLTKGEHLFTIDLIPRFTGKYTLNPARAELMYFPIFYGNEGKKDVEIHD